MSRGFKSKHSRAVDAAKDCKDLIKQLFADRARRGAPSDDVKDISWKLQNTRLSDEDIFQMRAALRRMLAHPAPSGSSSSRLDSWMHGGDWQEAMQFVKSMVCDPAQFEKLCRNASYDDAEALRQLKGEFDAAKSSGRKVEKHPQDWLRAKDLVSRAKIGKKQQRNAFYQEPKSEPARKAAEKPASQNKGALQSDEDKLAAACDELLQNQGRCSMAGSEVDALSRLRRWIRQGIMDDSDWKNLKGIIETIHKRNGNGSLFKKSEDSLLDRCRKLKQSGRLMLDEEDALQEMESDAKMGVNLANIQSDLAELERRVAARSAVFDVEKALAEVLAPENEKFISFKALRRVKDSLPDRNRMASDWFNDRVAEAYAELNENRLHGKVVNSAEIPENKIGQLRALAEKRQAFPGKKTDDAPKLNDGTLVHNKMFLVQKIYELLEKIGGADARRASSPEKFILQESARSLTDYRSDLAGDFDYAELPRYVALFNDVENGLRPILAKAAQEIGSSQFTILQINGKISELLSAINVADYRGGTVDDRAFGAARESLWQLRLPERVVNELSEKAASADLVDEFLSIEASVKGRFKLYGVEYEPLRAGAKEPEKIVGRVQIGDWIETLKDALQQAGVEEYDYRIALLNDLGARLTRLDDYSKLPSYVGAFRDIEKFSLEALENGGVAYHARG